MDRACKHLPSCKIWDATEICTMRIKKEKSAYEY